jgi:iron complex outermembrane receptor protein
MMYHNFDAYSRIDNPTRQTTTEIRLGRTGDGTASSLTWVAGLYYFNLKQSAIAAYEYNCFCANDASPTYITSPNNVGRDLNDLNGRSYAGFAQATYSLTDRLRATLGGRYTHDKKSEDGTQVTNLYTIGVVVTPPDVGSATWSNFSWKAGLEADLTPSSLVYTSVSTGYKAGGLNEGFNAAPYAPEKLTAFSVGSKNNLWNNRVILNGEVFYWDYKNHQVATTSGLPSGGVGYVGVNIPRSTEYGLDLDLQALVTSHDRLSVSAEYLVGKTGSYTLPTSSIGVFYTTSGTSMISAPRWNSTVELAHDWDVPNGGSIIAAGLFHYTSKQLLYGIAVPNAYAPGAGVGDVNLTYKAPKDTWYIRAYVNNVAQKAVVLSVFPGYEARDFVGPNPGSDFVQYGNVNPPRTFGVRVGTHF